jgi:ribosomal protein S18 acetylase RimI-like enzyme
MIETIAGWAVTPERRAEISRILYQAFGQKLAFLLRRGSEQEHIETLDAIMNYANGLVFAENGETTGVGLTKARGQSTYRPEAVMRRSIGWLRARILSTFIDQSINSDDVIRVDQLAVREDRRGHGIGTTILERIFEDAREQGLTRVTLDVVDSNPGARRLYESLGFREIHTRRIPGARRYGFREVIDMEKRLD